MRTWTRVVPAIAIAAGMALPAMAQTPVGTAVTYQGRLRSAGSPVNGAADLQFRLFDALTGGNQVGVTQSFTNVAVVDGFLTAQVDFSAGAFSGEARFIEVAVRSPAGVGGYLTLSPRQRVTAAPYALRVAGVDGHSLDAADGSPTDALFVDSVGSVGIGTSAPQGPLDVRSGNGSYVRVDGINGDLHMNGGTDSAAGLFNDSTAPDARLAFVLQDQTRMVVTADGRVGIGTVNPIHRLHVSSSSSPAIVGESSNHTGVWASTDGWGARALVAHAGSPSGPSIGVSASTSSTEGRGLSAIATAASGVNYGVHSMSNSSSGYDFFAAGAGVNYGASSSRRWKRNVETIDDPLGLLARMRGVYFDWDQEHGGHHDVGMIAEEVGEVLPEVVAYEDNGVDATGMDYSKLTPLLVEAVKEQQRQLEELRRLNAEFREELAELRSHVAARGVPGAD